MTRRTPLAAVGGLRHGVAFEPPPDVTLTPIISGIDGGREKSESIGQDPAFRIVELAVEDALSALPFTAAFDVWLQAHTPFIQPGTIRSYKQYGEPLKEFFAERQVKAIGYSGVRAYQLWRSRETEGEPKGYAHGAGNLRIRNEINGVLKPLLKEAGCWEEIKSRRFKHLPVSRDGAGTFITPEEQREILGVAFSMPRMKLASRVIRLMSRTGCGVGELSKVRPRDVNLEAGSVQIVLGAKNSGSRVRRLTLTPTAKEDFAWCLDRWKKLGGTDRNQCLFPHRKLIRNGGGFDRPMSGIYRAWVAIKSEWIRRFPHRANRKNIRLYDWRVSVAVTLLKNGQLSLATIEKALGWKFGSRMVQRYYKPEEQVLRDALNTLEDVPPQPAA